MNETATMEREVEEIDATEEETTTLPEGQEFGAVVKRLEAERSNRMDLVLNTQRNAALDVDASGVRIDVMAEEAGVDGKFDITDHAHSQIAQHAGIPLAYYRRMLSDQPELLKRNVETWWRQEPSMRMARILAPRDGASKIIGGARMRGWMSNGYRVLDNFDFAVAALDAAEEFGAQAMRSHVDDNRLHIKLLVPGTVELPVRRAGTTATGLHAYHLRFGVVLSNSEVGAGALSVRCFMSQWECTNDSIFSSFGDGEEAGLRAVHAGSRKSEGILSPATIQKEAEVVMDKVRDWTRFALNPANQENILARIAATTAVPVDAPARLAVANVVGASGMSNAEAHAVLERYLRGNDDTQWGLAAAVTNAAHSTPKSYGKRVELETFGGRMLEMEAAQFAALVQKPMSDKQVAKLFGEN